MTRVEQIDAELDATRLAYNDAIERLDDQAANQLHAHLDELLDERIHIPLQRPQPY